MAGIEILYLFPVFQTREAYELHTGNQCPPYDPDRDVKSWFDPDARNSRTRSVLYPRVIALGVDGRTPAVGEDGQPFFEPLQLPKDIAATVNIPPKDVAAGVPDAPTTGREVPVPCRELKPAEFVRFAFGNTVQVVDTSLSEYQQQPDQVNHNIQTSLARIEAKLDQLLAK